MFVCIGAEIKKLIKLSTMCKLSPRVKDIEDSELLELMDVCDQETNVNPPIQPEGKDTETPAQVGMISSSPSLNRKR